MSKVNLSAKTILCERGVYGITYFSVDYKILEVLYFFLFIILCLKKHIMTKNFNYVGRPERFFNVG